LININDWVNLRRVAMPTNNFLSINVGTTANSKDGDTLRSAFQKINQNFNEIDGLIQEYFDEFLNTENLLPTEIQPTTPNTNVTISSTGTGIIVLNAPLVQISNNVTIGGSLAITDDVSANDGNFSGDVEISGNVTFGNLLGAKIDCGRF
jgi:hypothetical protein